MENSRIKEATLAISQSLGIDLDVIISDIQLEPQQKFRLIYEKVLTASLTRWIRNDDKGELRLPPDFNIEEFVTGKMATLPVVGSPEATDGQLQYIPNILLTPKRAERVKNAKESQVTDEVNSLFEMTIAILQNERFDWKDVTRIFIEAGVAALTITAGMVVVEAAAIAAVINPSFAAGFAVAAGLFSLGVTELITILSKLYALFTSGILFNRSFLGVVINDTDKDLLIPNWKDKSNAKSRNSGVYCRHGWLSGLMVDDYNGGQGAIVGKRTAVNKDICCYCGLYLLEKNTGATGSEGFFRFKIGKVEFDLNATCPMSSHNRVYTSFNYTDENLYKANSDVANEWKKKSKEELLYGKATKDDVSVTYSLNDLTGSPAYGIVTVE